MKALAQASLFITNNQKQSLSILSDKLQSKYSTYNFITYIAKNEAKLEDLQSLRLMIEDKLKSLDNDSSILLFEVENIKDSKHSGNRHYHILQFTNNDLLSEDYSIKDNMLKQINVKNKLDYSIDRQKATYGMYYITKFHSIYYMYNNIDIDFSFTKSNLANASKNYENLRLVKQHKQHKIKRLESKLENIKRDIKLKEELLKSTNLAIENIHKIFEEIRQLKAILYDVEYELEDLTAKHKKVNFAVLDFRIDKMNINKFVEYAIENNTDLQKEVLEVIKAVKIKPKKPIFSYFNRFNCKYVLIRLYYKNMALLHLY